MTSGGCMDTILKTIHILQQQVPIADFTASSFNPYIGQKVNLIDQSVYKPTKWKWTITPSKYTFYNNTNDSSQNPVVSFDSLATYSVFLEATNAAGSTTTSKQVVTKNYSKPTAIIGAQTTFVRVGEQVSFIDSSSNDPTSWNWEFGDTASGGGNFSNLQYPYHAYGKAGFYDIKLKVANPAGLDSTERKSYVQVSNGFNMCDNTATSSQVFQGFLYDSGGPNNNYNDGSDCEFLIEPPCAGKIFFSFSSFNLASGDYLQIFDGRDSVAGIPLFTGKGFTGANNPGTLVANSGSIYIRELSDAVGNAAGFSASWSAAANVKPRARIGNDSVAWVNSPINFRNTTTVGLQNKYYWDFNDDGINDDSSYQPQFSYNTIGMRKIRLIATNCAGSDTLYKFINIKVPNAIPVAGFISDHDTVAVADYVNFTDLSLNGPSSWFWEITPNAGVVFVNGTSQSSQNPEVVFTVAGNYNVCLTATNVVGSSQKLCKSNYIIVKDRAAMCVGNTTSTVAAGYFYDSGDQPSNYGDNENCNFLIQSCADNVVLNFSKFDVMSGDYLRVYDGIDNTGVPLFSGNGFSGNSNPGPLTGFSGSLYIEFQSDNSGTGAGWEAQWSSSAVPAPQALFVPPVKAFTNCITWLRNNSIGKNTTSDWDFDNNGSLDSTGREGYTIYTTPGNKTALLSVSNCAGSDTYAASFTVQNPSVKPQAGFYANYTMGDLGSVIYLYDTSQNGANAWTWSITPANGWVIEEDLGYRLRINFTDSGDYTVCLTAGNAFGTDQTCKNAYIKIRPYCKPAPSFFSGVGISRISLNNFAQNSPIDRLYSDYTNLGAVTRLERKAAYDLTLEKNVSGAAQNWKAWIDWDNNGLFDNNETILTAGTSTALSVTGNFKVDRNALIGIHRMRVSASYNNNPNTPCNVLFGEVQDYLIEVTNDLTKPVITLIGSNPDSLEQGYTYSDKGATAFDLADGNLTSAILSGNNINNMVLGSYQVTYDVTDSAGNKADRVIRTVLVTDDITPPVLTLVGSTVEKWLVKVPYVDKGFTSSDKVDGNITAGVLVTGSVDVNKLGSYSLTYTSIDKAGNSSVLSRLVQVIDTLAPVIKLNGSDTLKLKCNDVYNDPGYILTDNYDTLTTANATVSGTVNTAVNGTYVITYNAKDKSNNAATTKKRFVVISGCPNGMDALISERYISIFPNPAADKVYIEPSLPEHITSAMVLYMFDETGREILTTGINQGKNEIDLTSRSSGIYLIRIVAGDDYYQVKLIKY
jgi:PKD repeat protein